MTDRSELVEHYDAADERARLTAEPSLELLRTQALLQRVLPAAPGRILDVGGGPGVHAAWLSGLGHSVHLVDPVPKHVDQAGAAGTFTVAVGDAVALDEADDSYDVVLLLGPLYHLTERADRLRALREARRVARPGGVVAAAAISRYASLMDGYYLGFTADPTFVEILAEDLRTGRHHNPTDHPRHFTTTYFHTCAELRAEVVEADLDPTKVLPVEGLLGWSSDLEGRLADPAQREFVLHCLERTEDDPAVTAASPHILALARVHE